jgi:hypothetical protein
MANLSHITRCGLPGIEWIPFGMRPCHFYTALTGSLRRYCRTLSRVCAATSACLWVTAPLLPAREAVQALRAACDDVDDAIQVGTLRLLVSARLKGLDLCSYTAFASRSRSALCQSENS